MARRLELVINGKSHRIAAEPERSLLTVLRDELALTGAKYGCGEGACGACTVLVDGRPERACVTAPDEVSGKRITTIEGLEDKNGLHPVQQAFLDAGAMQCGYCIPGMILGAVALLAKKAAPTHDEIVQGMDGHVCRCGTYPRIVAAIRAAAAGSRSSGSEASVERALNESEPSVKGASAGSGVLPLTRALSPSGGEGERT